MKTFLTGLIGLFVFALGAGASAAPPQREYFQDAVNGLLFAHCHEFGFDILYDYKLEGRAIYFFDNEGYLKGQKFHVQFFDSRYYNSVDPSQELWGGPGEVDNVRIYGDPPTLASSGLLGKLTVPGYGMVLVTVGHLLYDLTTGEILFEAGQSSFVDRAELKEETRSLLCELLAG